MSNIMKDLAAILFSAGEELEKKAEEYRSKREARHEEFDQQLREHNEELKDKCSSEMQSIKEKVTKEAAKLGLATKDDIEELKEMVKSLSKKIEENNQ